MLIPIIYNKGLPKEVIHNIENKNYSTDELLEIHQRIKKSYTNKTNGFSMAIVAVIICAVFVIVLGMMNLEKGTSTFFVPFVGIILCVTIAVVFVRKNIVDKSKNQFIKAVAKGYPEMAGKFGKNSFK